MNTLIRHCKVEVQNGTVINNKVKFGNVITTFENKNSVGTRIDFTIDRLPNCLGGGMSTAQIKLYNLKDDTFDYLASNGYKVFLSAGYGDMINPIFIGNILTVLRKKIMTDVVTTLYCNTNFSNNNVDSLISEPITSMSLNTLLKKIASKQGIKSSIDDFKGVNVVNTTFENYSTTDILNFLAIKYKFNWWLDNDILKIKRIPQNTAAHIFTPESGLLKPPMKTELGVDIEVFLQPFISPSDLFELSSKFADYNLAGMEFVERVRGGNFDKKRVPKADRFSGKYSILTLTHEGSTHTNSWYTRIVGQTVK